MDLADREKLVKNLTELVRLITDGHAVLEDLFRRRKLFSFDMYRDRKVALEEEQGSQGLCSLIMSIATRGPKAFDLFLEALVETGHFDAAQLLKPEMDVLSMSHELRLKASGLRRSSLSTPNFVRERTYSAPSNAPFRVLQLVNEFQGHGLEEYDALPFGPGAPASDPDKHALNPGVVRPDRALREYRIKRAEKLIEGPNIYPMKKSPRGHVLIINNEEFTMEELLRNRAGSQFDCDALTSVFEQLHFQVTVERNKGVNDMKRIIRNFAASADHAAAEACFVVVMSHGNSDKGRDYVYASDNRELEMRWIHEQFNHEHAPHLFGKPKVFIYQCCRGDMPDGGVVIHEPMEVTCQGRIVETDGKAFLPRKIPTFFDMLFVYATAPGYASFRERDSGTWFIRTLCEMLEKHAADTDFHEIVNSKVAERLIELESSCGEKQTSEVTSRGFTKKLYLNPGWYEDSDDSVELELPTGPL